jgi:PAS domain-containing protein
MSVAAPMQGADLDELRRHKEMFDNTWTLATVLMIALVILSWYFSLAQFDITAIIWTLATLAAIQFALSALARQARSGSLLRLLALASQLWGTVMTGAGWHLIGGIQQPLLPLFAVLPLLPASLLLNFWQQQAALLTVVLVLASGLLLSPDTNSFIAQHYGLSIGATPWLPSWLPRSRVAFPDVSTSPPYNLVLIITVAVIGVSLSTAARALVGLFRQGVARTAFTVRELARLEGLNTQLVTRAPYPHVLVRSDTGRIVNASERFASAFELPRSQGLFLLDAVAFAHPSVVRRLLNSGGEELLGATVRGRDAVLRLRAELIGSGESQLTSMSLEICDEVYWRGAVDSLDEPAFVVNAAGRVVFMNRAARATLGAEVDGIAAAPLFDSGPGWWDIAPLETSRRIVQRGGQGGQQYVAAICRARPTDSIGELAFVRLYARTPAASAAPDQDAAA